MLIFELLQYWIVVAIEWIVAACIVLPSYSFTHKKWPLCSISFRLVRAPSAFGMLLPVAISVVVEVLNFILYSYVRYQTKTTYMKYCVNQAHLNLASRIALEHCIKTVKVMLHAAIVHGCCFIVVYCTLYGLVLLKNFDFIQWHHVDFEVLFNQGSIMIFMIAFPIICLWGIPSLKAKLRSLFRKQKAGPIGISTFVRREMMKQPEGHQRLQHLTQQWATACPSKKELKK